MKTRTQKASFIAFLLIFTLFLPVSRTAAAASGPDNGIASGVEEIVSEFAEKYRLTESNFAFGWYDVCSGESWYYGEDSWMTAGSMYKLPLAMYYLDKIEAGELNLDSMLYGYRIEYLLQSTIVYSNNDTARMLANGLSLNYAEYREMIAKYSGLETDELPDSYYQTNTLSPYYLIHTLQYLYEHSEKYSLLLDYMKQAHPGQFFRSTQGDYKIAHKYGAYEGAVNDCGIIYTPRPFLLVVFTKNVGYSVSMLGELCAALTEYSLALYEKQLREPVVDPNTGFCDVATDAYYYDAVAWAVENSIANGTGEITFSPDDSCTYGQFLTFLWRAAGSLESSVYHSSADQSAAVLQWAYESGLAAFQSNVASIMAMPCSRALAVELLWLYAGKPESAGKTTFTDVPANYAEFVSWATGQQICSGTAASLFSPDAVCTRGQALTFLYRYMAAETAK
ncbi:MAG: serine hydrolase [Oscillospiraceae bacterium]|nr:serine hydrolase [Oscillospiraceae bacterium]